MEQNANLHARTQDWLKSEIAPVVDHLGFFFPLSLGVLGLEKSEEN